MTLAGCAEARAGEGSMAGLPSITITDERETVEWAVSRTEFRTHPHVGRTARVWSCKARSAETA